MTFLTVDKSWEHGHETADQKKREGVVNKTGMASSHEKGKQSRVFGTPPRWLMSSPTLEALLPFQRDWEYKNKKGLHRILYIQS